MLPSKLKGLKGDIAGSLKLNNNSLKATNISRPKLTNLNTNQINEISEPFYHTIDALATNKPPSKNLSNLGRNCVSLENIGAATQLYRNEINLYGNNLLQNYAMQWEQLSAGYIYPPYIYSYPYGYYGYPIYQPPMNNVYYGPGNGNGNDSRTNSKQSLRTNSTDDFRKYRDVAL